MEKNKNNILGFLIYCIKEILFGSKIYYAWLLFLTLIAMIGVHGYWEQIVHGHIVSNMRDPVPWGLFIGTYAFLVGVAAAAVALAVPGYVYNWKPIKEIVVLGEIIAITSVVMAILYVVADLGHSERFWHMVPIVGKANVPSSMIGMNVLILNSYMVLNIVIVSYFLYCSFMGRPYNRFVFMTLMLTSIPAAVSIHTTTAFIFNVLQGSPYWNAAILVARFIATALGARPALLIVTFQVLRKVAKIDIQDKALLKIAEMMLIVLIVSLLLFFAELVTELRSATAHTVHMEFYFSSHEGGEGGLGVWAWSGAICNITGFFLLLFRRTRNNLITLNIACLLVFVGVFIEKGIGLVLPGFFPGTLGEMYVYVPSFQELKVAVGIAAIGGLVFTVICKAAVPIAFEAKEETTTTVKQGVSAWRTGGLEKR